MAEVETHEAIGDADECLYRQVHPSFVHDGRVTSQAFKPTPKDQHQLSVDRASLTNPRDSYIGFTTRSGCRSVGVLGITVGECRANDLRVYPDPIATSEHEAGNPAHARIDFASLPSDSQREKRAKKLARCARARGWLYRPG